MSWHRQSRLRMLLQIIFKICVFSFEILLIVWFFSQRVIRNFQLPIQKFYKKSDSYGPCFGRYCVQQFVKLQANYYVLRNWNTTKPFIYTKFVWNFPSHIPFFGAYIFQNTNRCNENVGAKPPSFESGIFSLVTTHESFETKLEYFLHTGQSNEQHDNIKVGN